MSSNAASVTSAIEGSFAIGVHDVQSAAGLELIGRRAQERL
jgi:hypothetical protein